MRHSVTSFFIVPLFLAAVAAGSQQAATRPSSQPTTKPLPMQAYEISKGPGGDLAAVVMLEQAEAQVPPDQRNMWLDVLATRLIFIGDHRKAQEFNSKAYAQLRPGDSDGSELKDYKPASAVETIVKLAEGRRVLMLNEEHRSSRERAFANELLVPLKEAGFTHLALETIGEETAALEERKYPLMNDGFYTRDPVLGDLVRRALELGMGIVAYEADMSKMPASVDRSNPIAPTNWRENEQATNLANFVKDNPEARVVVWSGRHHMSEDAAEAGGGGQTWTPMGGIFKNISGIDPLTVDLMVLNEQTTRETEHKTYRWATEQGLVQAPTIFVNEAGEPWSPLADSIDAGVFFPRTSWKRGRPEWLKMGGARVGLSFDWSYATPEKPTPERPLVVEARLAGESDEAVPLDRVIWREGEAPPLYVRPGKAYRFELRDPEGNVIARSSVKMNEQP